VTLLRVAQSIHGNGATISGAKFYLKKVGAPAGNMTAYLCAHSGTFGSTSIGTTTIYATSTAVAASTVGTDLGWIEFTFPTPYTTAANTDYVIYLAYTGTSTNYIQAATDTSTPTHQGNYSSYTGTTWTAASGTDLIHQIKNNKGYFTHEDAVNSQYPTNDVASTVDNSLVLYTMTHSSVSVPGFLEGPVTSSLLCVCSRVS